MRNKICVDCDAEHNRASVVCLDCSKKRQRVAQQAHQKRRRGKNRKPCRACGEKMSVDIPPAERYCSDECRNSKDVEKKKQLALQRAQIDKAHALLKEEEKKQYELNKKITIKVPKKPKGYINPKYLVRNYSGEKKSMGTGISCMNA